MGFVSGGGMYDSTNPNETLSEEDKDIDQLKF
jgi:hypothetical protein